MAYTKAEEPGVPLNRKVAEPRFPVAMYAAKRGWTVVKTQGELADMYRKYNVALKESWTPRGSVSFEGPDNNVAMVRRASAHSTDSGPPSRRPSRVNLPWANRRLNPAPEKKPGCSLRSAGQTVEPPT
ncbi:hypothetical protein FAZ69_20115 [Trinickia terrae]|uniref:Uncharacterized protein n=1 Tax=Trinickia terrae TaxID=2571161 RepID=A0A4V5PM77_9BURK|nr:hypothetical protein [Trinickia terrae]TKC86930.1 hypothetical protein FAZ69_20115 [Trinickia terrae]